MPFSKSALFFVAVFICSSCSTLFPSPEQREWERIQTKQQEEADEAAQRARGMGRTEMFVHAGAAWVCPSAEAAMKNVPCKGGQAVKRNEVITVVGEEPVGGLWKTESWSNKGAREGFVRGDLLGEGPNNEKIDSFVAAMGRKYPENKRLQGIDLTMSKLLENPAAFRGYHVILRTPSSAVSNWQFAKDKANFQVQITADRDTRQYSLVAMSFRNGKWVSEFSQGKKQFSCGRKHCDEFAFVATYNGELQEEVDAYGRIYKRPLFHVREFADRFGAYSSL